MFRKVLAVLILGVLCVPQLAWSKCANRQMYYCVGMMFKKADPSLKKKDQFPGHCAGIVELKGILTPIVFQDKGECPAPDTPVSGHLISICQDTGKWTSASYWFAHRVFFCGVSYEQRRDEARELISKIRPRKTTRAQVRELLKDYEYIGAGFSEQFVEQYYGHPNILIEVPFAEPGGPEEKVIGRASMANIDMPKP